MTDEKNETPAAAQDEAAPPQRACWVAVVGPRDGFEKVIEGYERMTENEMKRQGRDLYEVPDRDLTPFKYRWDDEAGRWTVLPKKGPARDFNAETVRAFALGFASLQKAGHKFPRETEEWLAWFSATFEGQVAAPKDRAN